MAQCVVGGRIWWGVRGILIGSVEGCPPVEGGFVVSGFDVGLLVGGVALWGTSCWQLWGVEGTLNGCWALLGGWDCFILGLHGLAGSIGSWGLWWCLPPLSHSPLVVGGSQCMGLGTWVF